MATSPTPAEWPGFDGAHAIDYFTFFHGVLRLAGWAHVPEGTGAAITSLALAVPGAPLLELASFGAPSPDLLPHFGAAAAQARFDERLKLALPVETVLAARLIVRRADGRCQQIRGLGLPTGDPAHVLAAAFRERLAGLGSRQGEERRFLEIGSRARSGIVRRDHVPAGWAYSGFDVLAGPNVDVVGDAHALSSHYPRAHFDAVMAISVLEHLLMPWKVVIELNRVLKPGALGLFMTHQCWPLHDQPWDFLRFSDQAWKALLNPATGFEIVAAGMGEPACIVPLKCHPATAFGEAPGGYLASAVLFRKVGDTALDWPVSVSEVLDTAYPAGTTARPG